ncbi:MAG: hypothetical protein Q8R18_00805 [bacterium]|nr:hypothetical protein [bacterium]
MLKNYIAQTIHVALDFDGCIAIGEHVKIKYAKEYHKININPRTCMSETYPLGSVMYKQLMDKVTVQHMDEYILDPHCKEVLNALCKESFRFTIITSRANQSLEACKIFVKKHHLPIEAIYGTNDQAKADMCRKIHARAIIDDSLKKLFELIDTPVHLFFLEREWNTHENTGKGLKGQISSISVWSEFAQKLREMKEMHEAICFYKNWINSDAKMQEIYNTIKKDTFLAQRSLQEYRRKQ